MGSCTTKNSGSRRGGFLAGSVFFSLRRVFETLYNNALVLTTYSSVVVTPLFSWSQGSHRGGGRTRVPIGGGGGFLAPLVSIVSFSPKSNCQWRIDEMGGDHYWATRYSIVCSWTGIMMKVVDLLWGDVTYYYGTPCYRWSSLLLYHSIQSALPTPFLFSLSGGPQRPSTGVSSCCSR